MNVDIHTYTHTHVCLCFVFRRTALCSLNSRQAFQSSRQREPVAQVLSEASSHVPPLTSPRPSLPQAIRVADSPPPYEMVAAKPPPYSALFASAPPTDDVIRLANGTSHITRTYVPVHAPLQDPVSHKSSASPPTFSLARQESYDAGLPTYQEAVRYISLTAPVPRDSCK